MVAFNNKMREQGKTALKSFGQPGDPERDYAFKEIRDMVVSHFANHLNKSVQDMDPEWFPAGYGNAYGVGV